MNKDACFTYVHMHQSQHADLFEEFCKDKLPKDDVFVPPDLQPINPEEEDDVVPDQHAAYGVQKATQKAREPAWKDLGLSELMARGPAQGVLPKRRPGAKQRGGGGGSQYQGLPR
ncbi:Apc13p protein-domain-containing protein [Thermothelomyces heterothallicus CBS 202.75]|uniref:Apc13p protein-domain-containing protein n=1 Tax=Thermothelomyces heterothallicus CBS 202.75 TaxID=1149848 RepID=UPI003742C9AD